MILSKVNFTFCLLLTIVSPSVLFGSDDLESADFYLEEKGLYESSTHISLSLLGFVQGNIQLGVERYAGKEFIFGFNGGIIFPYFQEEWGDAYLKAQALSSKRFDDDYMSPSVYKPKFGFSWEIYLKYSISKKRFRGIFLGFHYKKRNFKTDGNTKLYDLDLSNTSNIKTHDFIIMFHGQKTLWKRIIISAGSGFGKRTLKIKGLNEDDTSMMKMMNKRHIIIPLYSSIGYTF